MLAPAGLGRQLGGGGLSLLGRLNCGSISNLGLGSNFPIGSSHCLEDSQRCPGQLRASSYKLCMEVCASHSVGKLSGRKLVRNDEELRKLVRNDDELRKLVRNDEELRKV
jgi:hypothetical protein